MKREKLSKSEKQALRFMLTANPQEITDKWCYAHSDQLHYLSEKQFVKILCDINGYVVSAQLLPKGRKYCSEYPLLANPVNWAMVSTVIALLSLAVSIIALIK